VFLTPRAHTGKVKRRGRGLLGEIECGALDENTSLTSLLRKCVVLGGQVGSEKLRDWARNELQGYQGGAGVPRYRRVPAVILMDYVTFTAETWNEQISRYNLPGFARERIGEEIRFGESIAHLEELARSPEDHLKVVLPGSAEIMAAMNAGTPKDGPFRMVTRLYWVVSRSSIKAMVDQVRSSLVELVAEMVAAMPSDQAVPNKEAADQAIDVVFNGGERRNIKFVDSQAASEGARWWKRAVIIIVAVVAVVAVAAVL
jgi:hypothetical protein